jgi:hypothetical protein
VFPLIISIGKALIQVNGGGYAPSLVFSGLILIAC